MIKTILSVLSLLVMLSCNNWHGAAADSWFAHLAFEVSGENTSNEWLEPVTDDEYDNLGQSN